MMLQVYASCIQGSLNMPCGKNGCIHLLPAFMVALANSTVLSLRETQELDFYAKLCGPETKHLGRQILLVWHF